jgi:NAD(P)H-hydrate epimerase
MSDSGAAWPRAIYSSEQVRGLDRRAIENLGIDAFELMQRAAGESLRFLRRRWPEARSLLIYCGAGNNGGDGYALAALATRAGLDVRVIALAEASALRGAAAQAFELARQARVPVQRFASSLVPGFEPDLVVDALLGTGLKRIVEAEIAAAVAAINASECPVLALDIPTGLDSDTGEVHGVAVRADATVTFVGLKAGLYLGAGPDHRGELASAALDLPDSNSAGVAPVLRRCAAADVACLLRPRSRTSHKGLNGRVLIVGGATGMGGAARLAAEAALRAGAGLVHAAVATESVAAVMAGRPEIQCRGIDSPDDIADLMDVADVIVVGPGLGRERWGARLAAAVLPAAKPLVVDADALNFLALHPHRRHDWVLTPHAGEAGRLLQKTAAGVQSARARAVLELAQRFGGIAVLKGACSLIAQADETAADCPSVCDYGNPGMATAGMGDVLAGVIAALIAQLGFSRQSVEAAVVVHALAGDDAARDGERGLMAADLFPHIRRRVNPP